MCCFSYLDTNQAACCDTQLSICNQIDGSCDNNINGSDLIGVYIGVIVFLGSLCVCTFCFWARTRMRTQALDRQGLYANYGGTTYGAFPRHGNKGVSRDVLANIPTYTYTAGMMDNESSLCTICLAEYSLNDSLRALPCKHHFHTACIDRWLKDHDTCPLCVQPVTKDSLIVQINS